MADYLAEIQKKQNKATMMTVVNCIPIVCDNIEDPGKREESINELRNDLIRLIKVNKQNIFKKLIHVANWQFHEILKC